MFACSVKCTNSTREGNIRISLRNTTSRRVVKLYCRTGYYFIVKGNGKVKGSQRDNDTKKYGTFKELKIIIILLSVGHKDEKRIVRRTKNKTCIGFLAVNVSSHKANGECRVSSERY